MEDLISVKSRVNYLLSTYIETRDCDRELWLKYMTVYHGLKYDIQTANWKDFRKTMLDSSIAGFETISRCRRKLQEMNENLRGNLYLHRQFKQHEVIKLLKEF